MSPSFAERLRRHRGVLIPLALVLATPMIVRGLAFLEYLSEYQGVCGPHFNSLAQPCSLGLYAGDFEGGMAGFGLFLLEGLSFFAALAVWAVVAMVRRARATPSPNPRGS